jgi:polygalacturonase
MDAASRSHRESLCLIAFILLSAARCASAGKVLDATAAGITGDGTTLNTRTIQKAIDNCAASGGGTIRFPAGRYLTGTIQIKSNVTLRLENQATLLGSPNIADYRNMDPFTDGDGDAMGDALIVAVGADHAGLEGSGTVDGQNAQLAANEQPFVRRPFLVRWVRCTNVVVRDIHLLNPGAWTLEFFRTKGVVIDGVTIRSRTPALRNTDGIDLNSSENVRVKNCDVISGDDSLVIKSTSSTAPSRDIIATDCKFSSRGNGIKLGTESIGGFENISVSSCQIENTGMSGIALYEVDGGNLRNVTISDITMDGVAVPISIRLGSRLNVFRAGEQPKPTAGRLADVAITNVNAKNIRSIGMLINGIPDHPIENLTVRNIQMSLSGGGTARAADIQLSEKEAAYPEWNMFGKTFPAYGIYARHVRGLSLQNVVMTTLKADARPATVLIDVEESNAATQPGRSK